MTPDQGTVVLLRSLAIDPCIVRKLRLRSRLLRWARCKAILKSHAHPEMPFCRFRMARMARPALNHQRARIALVAQRWPTSSLRSSATCWRRRRRRILPCRSHIVSGTLCQTPTERFAPIGQATTALPSIMASQWRVQSSRHAAEPSRFIQRPQDAPAS